MPRNEWYGFRTPRTMASDEVWYRANRLGGQYYFAAGILMLLWFAALALFQPARLWLGGWLEATILLLPLAIATVLWYRQVRRF